MPINVTVTNGLVGCLYCHQLFAGHWHTVWFSVSSSILSAVWFRCYSSSVKMFLQTIVSRNHLHDYFGNFSLVEQDLSCFFLYEFSEWFRAQVLFYASVCFLSSQFRISSRLRYTDRRLSAPFLASGYQASGYKLIISLFQNFTCG